MMSTRTRFLYVALFSIFIFLALIIILPYRPRVIAVFPNGDKIRDEIPVYRIDEKPRFLVYSDTLVRQSEKKQDKNRLVAQVGTIEAEVFDSNGLKTELQPEIESYADESSVFQITIPNDRLLVPGTLSLSVRLTHENKQRVLAKKFQWDPTILNFNQSSYAPGEAVQMAIGVLNNNGEPDCDTAIQLVVTAPDREKALYTTKGNTILPSRTCTKNEPTNEPDYRIAYIPKLEGTYRVRFETKTGDKSWIHDTTFYVTRKADFTIRSMNTPLRVLPGARYATAFEVRADTAFDGEVYYDIPSAMTVYEMRGNGHVVKGNGITDTIVWPIKIASGTSTFFSFTFSTTNSSPAFYLTGPVRILKASKPQAVGSFEHSRDSYSFISLQNWELIAVPYRKQQ